MAALGRVLQLVGWMWVIAGFLLPAFGLARANVFPGFVLIFIARALRSQAARQAPPEEVEEAPAPPELIPNVERPREERKPAPVVTPPVTGTAPPTPPTQPGPVEVPAQPSKRDDLIEKIAARREEIVEEVHERPAPMGPDLTLERPAPKTSAEMIAEAKKRWDKKPRRS